MKTYSIGDSRKIVRRFEPGWHQVKGERWLALNDPMQIPVIQRLKAPEHEWSKPRWEDEEILVDEAKAIPPPQPSTTWYARMWRWLGSWLGSDDPQLPEARALPAGKDLG